MIKGTPMQAVLVTQAAPKERSTPMEIALFNEDGSPFAADQTGMVPAATQATFAGADITALKVELNAFLDKLIAASLMEAS